MERDGYLDIDSSSAYLKRKQSIKRCIQSLKHACQCQDADCQLLPNCQCHRLKRVVKHSKVCKRKTNGGCPICKQLIALCCYHAKHCSEAKCPMLLCSNIKYKIKQQQLQQRLQELQLMRRRMAVMGTLAGALISSGPRGGSAAGGYVQNMSPGSVAVGAVSALLAEAHATAGVLGGMQSPHQQGINLNSDMQTPPAN